MKIKLILDTNVFLLLYEGINPLEELEELFGGRAEFYTLKPVIHELKKLSGKKGSRKGRAASLVLDSGILGRVKVIEFEGRSQNVDESILEYVSSNPEFAVVTLDAELRNRLKNAGIKVLTWWRSMHRFSTG
ncbi:MAG: hypothetical protein J7L55_01480 [Desulfurococcales archaeon]|nr:hypothetical protein [Desulfurococcales archaeon]